MNTSQQKWEESFKMGREYNPMNEVLFDLLLEQVTNDKKTAIDLGCGTGDIVIKLAKRGMKVTGTDWSQNALLKASTKAKAADVSDRTNFQEIDLNNLTKLTHEASLTDIVLCKLVIAFVEDKMQFCREVKSLLKADGVFIVQTPVLYDHLTYTPEDKPEIAVNFNEIVDVLNKNFSKVTEFNHSYYSERGDLVTFIAYN